MFEDLFETETTMNIIRCEAPTITPTGEVAVCGHIVEDEAEGRYCTCCEYNGGLITPPEAITRLITRDVELFFKALRESPLPPEQADLSQVVEVRQHQKPEEN